MSHLAFAVAVALCATVSAAGPAAKPAGLGGGYKEAKWGMTVAEVKAAFKAKLEFESKSRGDDKFLDYDLGEGRKVTLQFDRDKFYRALYKPLTEDGDAKTAETVLAGLDRKYGKGKRLDGYQDAEDRPLVMVEWTDGVSRILFRMPDLAADRWKGDQAKFPKTQVVVTYSNIQLENAQAKRREEDRLQKKQAEPKPAKLEDDL